MKTPRTRLKRSIISVRGLVFIYALLCVLMVLFSRTFFSEILSEGQIPGRLSLIVFLTIPVVLLVFLGVSAFDLFADMIARRAGSKFKARLLIYFFIIVVFSAAPGAVVTALSTSEILRFWKNLDTKQAIQAGRAFSVDSYSYHIERFENLLDETDFGRIRAGADGVELPEGIAAVQDFTEESGGTWQETFFRGGENARLSVPPADQQGYAARTIPRDAGMIRYVTRTSGGAVSVITYSLGDDFDSGAAAVENLGVQFETIDSLEKNIRPLVFFYYAVFFFPSLLMTLIIAISFTRRVTSPIVELTEATRRVAEGDFSIQILSRRGDELGLLIRSFNAMVQDLEKSRAALVKAEKISIWQNMAQQLAHEIKNPLTPIKLSAERVLRRWRNEPEKTGEILESSMLAIIQETEGLSTLLNEFKTLSKPMEASQSWTNLQETIREIINPYRITHPPISFKIEHIPESITIKMDRHRLSQIVTNLVINALDSISGAGSIEIRADIVKKRDVRYGRLSVTDSGRGITEQEGALIFTPYFTTKDSGTGLGLPIVERIVNDHGGSIWFNSAQGTGTTFFVDLPIDNSDRGEGKPSGGQNNSERAESE